MCYTCPHKKLLLVKQAAEVQYQGIHPCHEKNNMPCKGHIIQQKLLNEDKIKYNGDLIKIYVKGKQVGQA